MQNNEQQALRILLHEKIKENEELKAQGKKLMAVLESYRKMINDQIEHQKTGKEGSSVILTPPTGFTPMGKTSPIPQIMQTGHFHFTSSPKIGEAIV